MGLFIAVGLTFFLVASTGFLGIQGQIQREASMRKGIHPPPPSDDNEDGDPDFLVEANNSSGTPNPSKTKRAEIQEIDGTQDAEHKIHVVFVSEGYDKGAPGALSFASDVRSFRTFLLSLAPFKERASAFQFHAVYTNEPLGCKYEGRLITCDAEQVKSKIRAAETPFDQIVVIVNSPQYGGSGGEMSVTYNGELGARVFIHEFGHSFGGLFDEYVYKERAGEPGAQCRDAHGNCYDGVPPATEWADFSPEYIKGCTRREWYRSSRGSIMLSLKFPYFNAVSQALLKRKIDSYFTHH